MITIDPGSAGDGCACARFIDGVLARVFFARIWQGVCETGVSTIVVERPAYQGARTERAHPEHLINLAWDGAALAYGLEAHFGARLIEYTPGDWKGSEPKPIQHKRLWAVLNSAERLVLGGDMTLRQIQRACEKGALKRWGIPGAKCYPASFATHNLLDAVAMGCVHMKRLKKAS